MNKTVEISRELLERIYNWFEHGEEYKASEVDEVRRLLAAPAAEHPLITCLHENGDLIAVNATIAQQAQHIEDLKALLAAPVVERQEPVAYIVEAIDPNNGHLRRRGLHWHSVETLRDTRDFKEWIGENITREQLLYTSPPAPVAVPLIIHEQLVEMRRQFERANFVQLGKLLAACLDKVKELNQ